MSSKPLHRQHHFALEEKEVWLRHPLTVAVYSPFYMHTLPRLSLIAVSLGFATESSVVLGHNAHPAGIRSGLLASYRTASDARPVASLYTVTAWPPAALLVKYIGAPTGSADRTTCSCRAPLVSRRHSRGGKRWFRWASA
jgi:hypothetical protein